MEFSLAAASGGHLVFPLNPERVTAQTGARMASYDVLELGEIPLPRGKVAAKISWEGRFPGRPLPDRLWKSPKELVHLLQTWRDSGEPLTLQVTQTPLHLSVYIENLEHTWGSFSGDCEYRLDLVQARPLIVFTEAEWGTAGSGPAAARPVPPPPRTYTVKAGDSLWAIAKRTLGAGERWPEIYAANLAIVGPDPNLIHPGQVLRIPGGGGAVR